MECWEIAEVVGRIRADYGVQIVRLSPKEKKLISTIQDGCT